MSHNHIDIDVRCPHAGEWIFVRPGAEYKRVAPCMTSNDGPLHLVADNIVENLREQGFEAPCERNGVRFFYATLFFVCGRTDPTKEDDSAFFFWPIECGNNSEEARAQEASGQWMKYNEQA